MNTAQLYEAIDLIAKGVTRPTAIARALAVTYRTYCNWMVRSNGGDEKFLIEVNGETVQFAKAVAQAMRLAHFELRGMVLQEAIGGYLEEQTRDGQVVWKLNAEACAIEDLDVREMLYGRRDGLLVIDGKLQPHTVRKKSPWAQQIRLLEAVFADLRPSQTINQNVAVNGTVGIGFAKPVDYSQGPPAIPPAPVPPQLEILPAALDAEFSEVADDDLDEMLGPVPVAPININIAPVINVAEPERVIRDTPSDREKIAPPTGKPPMRFDELPRRAARSPLEQSLFDELAKARERSHA